MPKAVVENGAIIYYNITILYCEDACSMRKRAAALLIGFIWLFAGCGISFSWPSDEEPAAEEPAVVETTPEPPDDRMTDEEFVAAVAKALQARWDVSAEYSASDLTDMGAAEYQAYLRRCVDAEEAQLGSIVDYRFMDSEIAALAQQYYHALSLQRAGSEFARTAEVNRFNSTWVLGYNYRVSAVWELMQDFSLTVAEEYASRLAELTATHYEAKKQVAFHELIERMSGTLIYDKDLSRSDDTQTCYVGWLENTTEYDIRSLSIGISFLDEDGNIIAQTSDWISDLRAGQGARSVIFAGIEEYAGMEYSISIYQ